MLCGNWCDLELQTTNIEWSGEAGSFSTDYCAVKKIVLMGALEVLLKDNVSTNYVADCSFVMPPITEAQVCRLFLSLTVQKSSNRPVLISQNSYLAPRLRGIKQKELPQVQK